MTLNTTIIPKELPQKLKRLRSNRGWSQGQLGKKLGVNIQRISKYERGIACPPTEMMIKITNLFEVSLDYLLRNEENIAINKIKNPQLLKNIEEIENLPEEDQYILNALLEAFIKKHRFESLAHQ